MEIDVREFLPLRTAVSGGHIGIVKLLLARIPKLPIGVIGTCHKLAIDGKHDALIVLFEKLMISAEKTPTKKKQTIIHKEPTCRTQ